MNDLYDRKISEYQAYPSSEAAEEAGLDIERGEIKLFYLDVSEFPEIIAIDGEACKLPEAEHVSIGTGCIDYINCEDTPPGYREAMENALEYGKRYNRVIADHFHLPLLHEEDLLPSETLDFIGYPEDWKECRIELADNHPLFGGREIQVRGTGTVLVRSVRPDPDKPSQGLLERIYRFNLEAKDIERIWRACLFNEFITLSSSSHPAPPDHARPDVILINKQGERHCVDMWQPPVPGGDRDIETRFGRVYRELIRLETVAHEHHAPLHTMPRGDSSVWNKLISE